ncbi:MAG: hypothetical protein NT129_00830 [Candidatus Aenigmarchaeota archaeon]|nr:hypothetical protein [Candidatus Aenigmarchaeota archaeon]
MQKRPKVNISKKDLIEEYMQVLFSQDNTAEHSRLFGIDRIEYIDNHLMLRRKDRLVFKVWLPYDKKVKNVKEAMKSVGMDVVM